MSNVFLSYARQDLATAAQLATTLSQAGSSVFFDQQISVGEMWDEVIDKAITEAKAVVVVWSRASRASRWVRLEAREGLRRGILCPTLAEDCDIPIEFKDIQTVDLRSWTGQVDHAECLKLTRRVQQLVGTPSKQKDPPQRFSSPHGLFRQTYAATAAAHEIGKKIIEDLTNSLQACLDILGAITDDLRRGRSAGRLKYDLSSGEKVGISLQLDRVLRFYTLGIYTFSAFNYPKAKLVDTQRRINRLKKQVNRHIFRPTREELIDAVEDLAATIVQQQIDINKLDLE